MGVRDFPAHFGDTGSLHDTGAFNEAAFFLGRDFQRIAVEIALAGLGAGGRALDAVLTQLGLDFHDFFRRAIDQRRDAGRPGR